jgi:hypothetical protein
MRRTALGLDAISEFPETVVVGHLGVRRERRRDAKMAQEHIEELRKARSALVNDRRSRAKAIPGARTSAALMSFIEVQQAIEAIDHAIKDEKNPPA